MNAIPSIETPRLLLRPYTRGHLEAMTAMMNDEAVVRFIGATKMDRSECWRRILSFHGMWALLGFGYWALEEKATGTYVGTVGFADFERDMTPSLGTTPESGWLLVSAAQGKGYGTEAMQAALRWSDEQQWPKTTCIIVPENVASIRVAEKLGYREVRRVPWREGQTIVWERPSPRVARAPER